jgi:hypothetical protein
MAYITVRKHLQMKSHKFKVLQELTSGGNVRHLSFWDEGNFLSSGMFSDEITFHLSWTVNWDVENTQKQLNIPGEVI